jgi:hypothetical protein
MRLIALLASAVLLASCGDVHTPGQDVTAPSSTTKPTPGAQASLVVNASTRSDQQLDITVQLLDGAGTGIPNVDVALSITGGTITPALAKTDASGTVKATAIASGTATLKATTGALTKEISVIGSATPLSVSMSIPSVVVGTASTLNASVTGQPIGGAFSYAWTFGDGKSDTGSGGSIAHAYPGIGTYNASVKVTDGAGRTASNAAVATVTDVPVVVTPTPAPAATKTLAATLSCTAQAHGTPTPCNVSVTYGGDVVASNAITSIVWDFGDGFTETVANSPIRSRNYAQAGAYTVTATATATTSDGSKTAPIASKAITVN